MAGPERKCGNCEYFDCGGRDINDNPTSHEGDCHNRMSPRFTTGADETCLQFFPDSIRFPDAWVGKREDAFARRWFL